MQKWLIWAAVLLTACNRYQKQFTLLPVEETSITFSNRITESDTMNILDFEYIYNGGGVAIADFNNDGLQDVYFTGNMVANKLYLNKGNFQFDDVTDKAGVAAADRWCSGVAVVDINTDGWNDLYVCATVHPHPAKRANLLFVNQGVRNGVPIFKEMAQAYGIADTTHTTNAAFFDYDNDGDLDLFLLVNEMSQTTYPNKYRKKVTDGSAVTTDRLYRNDYDSLLGHARFTNVSKQAGIVLEGFGLGVNICDINRDGWKDIYITNDYLTNDVFYINNRDGTFTDHAASMFMHTCHSAMGNDVADINNDGLADIIALDMLPEDNRRKKQMLAPANYFHYINNALYGYQHQYVRNTLQINQGTPPGTSLPVFSDIAMLAGIAETDWSWAPLVADFDSDGLRDIIVTNGFPKDITDRDFASYRAAMAMFAPKYILLDQIPRIKLKNYAFKNKGNGLFEKVTDQWGITQPSFSNGAAFADLDNDGDLDYVVNNIDDSAHVYRNNLIEQRLPNRNYLRIKFRGSPLNPMGLGAIVEIYYGAQQQFYEHTIYRGYLSSMENAAHFGLGASQQIDSLKITWQDGKAQILKNIPVNQVITLEWKNATPAPLTKKETSPPLFNPVQAIDYRHDELDYIDFNVQKLLPHKLSQYGPALGVTDANGDGLEDLFIAGSYQRKGRFFLQQSDGTFVMQDLIADADSVEKIYEDMGVLFFDADGDGDEDLYIASGGNEQPQSVNAYRDRFYLHQQGKFIPQPTAIPSLTASASCVKAADFDGDGDLDLFVGGRHTPHRYPQPASSFLLRNDTPAGGPVQFNDVTQQLAPALENIGMICDALWTDFDNDNDPDLLLAGEWMPLILLQNHQGRLTPLSHTGLERFTGWWNSLTGADFDNDGDIDYLAGNFGLNNLFRATEQHPARIYAADFNNDGNYDAIPTAYFLDDAGQLREFPFFGRDDMIKQMLFIKAKFTSYKAFAGADIVQTLGADTLKKASRWEANFLASAYVQNKGNGKFEVHPLPLQAQYSPVFGMLADDFDGDGNADALLVGNDYGTEVMNGRQDALYGLMLKGDGKGNFTPLSISQSGWFVPEDGKALIRVASADGQPLFVASRNQHNLLSFRSRLVYRKITPPTGATAALLTLSNGKVQRREIYYGSSFLSQNSRYLWLTEAIKKVEFITYKRHQP
ncbi:MAG: VCBS repeat-containing protein [Cytophagales bacterium]|nr:VCBS repeat-containing protein [Bernardetiaceae bacterium]MDW8211326.1 VCBS repeat-containing protein [Cytophagales bacterium]